MKFKILVISSMLMFSVYVLSLLYVGKEIKVNQWNITIDKISSIDSLSNIYDNDPNIVHWELSDDTSHLYTKETQSMMN